MLSKVHCLPHLHLSARRCIIPCPSASFSNSCLLISIGTLISRCIWRFVPLSVFWRIVSLPKLFWHRSVSLRFLESPVSLSVPLAFLAIPRFSQWKHNTTTSIQSAPCWELVSCWKPKAVCRDRCAKCTRGPHPLLRWSQSGWFKGTEKWG